MAAALNADDARGLRSGDRLMHVESGTPAVVESMTVSSGAQIKVVVRFGGNPRTDPWGPFVEALRRSETEVRDLERIVIESDQFSEWLRP